MLCKPSCRRRTLQRRLARHRAGGVKSCADSKQIRSCKTLRQPTCSPGKSRTESDESSNKFAVRYVRGQQYSVTALTDSSGTIKERYAYDAYGNPSVFDGAGVARAATAEGNRYTYTGREYDDVLDLYHYRVRMYDAIAGRFCSRDPIGYMDGPMQYQYVAANPTGRIDPGGLSMFWPGGGTVLPDISIPDLWDFPQFAWHYYFGGGRPYSVDPEDMQDFINGSSNAMGALRGMARGSAFSAATCGKTVQTHGHQRMNGFGLNVPKGSLWAFFRDKHILNTGTADVSWTCSATKSCCKDGTVESISLSCTVNVNYSDRFANPFDIGGEYHEHDPIKLRKCQERCRARYEADGNSVGYMNCNGRCWEKNPLTERFGAVAFNIFGQHSESFSENYKLGTCCD
ncbi:RHS repeat domain-containing protein [Planctomycetes bacterium TBK1r]|uniref:tRNA3(Ser)-specific nuclease WapA n=1 Tax=Stieleria magnilauensis TaxID=2527963 RepID=A0ABX5XQ20_9BACT|nr:tRNA3(Ser)-specific nuclease WapA precursor [Planctomycetes bacterium TBK1r]